MRRFFLATMLAVAIVGGAGGGVSGQDDPFIGTWRTNIPKSQYDPVSMTAKEPSTLVRTVAGAGFRVTASRPGSPPHLDYTFSLDGKDYPLTGTTSADAVAVIRVDTHTQIQLRKKNGVVVSIYRQVVSQDGKTFTSSEIGYRPGLAYHNVLVFDRQ